MYMMSSKAVLLLYYVNIVLLTRICLCTLYAYQ